jgi:adenylate kinase family enzyme
MTTKTQSAILVDKFVNVNLSTSNHKRNVSKNNVSTRLEQKAQNSMKKSGNLVSLLRNTQHRFVKYANTTATTHAKTFGIVVLSAWIQAIMYTV